MSAERHRQLAKEEDKRAAEEQTNQTKGMNDNEWNLFDGCVGSFVLFCFSSFVVGYGLLRQPMLRKKRDKQKDKTKSIN